MAPINRNSISLYEDAKATFVSLLQQTAQVGAGLIIMLLLTGGNPPGFIMGSSFVLGVSFVAWCEKNRLEQLTTSVGNTKKKREQLIKIMNAPVVALSTLDNSLLSNEEVIASLSDFDLNKFLPETLSNNKRAILKTKIDLIAYQTTLLEIHKIIQKILSIKTNDFFELAQILDLDIKKDFARSNLKGANLWDADLEGANLVRADLEGADLEGADLRDANLEGANLGFTDLVRADLEGANLKGADLEGAYLEGAYLRNADLEGANVENARFGYNKGLSDEMIKELKNRGAIFIDLQGDPRTVEIKR